MVEVQHADDVVDAVLIDRQAGIGRILNLRKNIIPVVVDVNGLHIHARGHDLGGGNVGKVDRRLHKLGLVFVEDFLVLGGFNDGLQLFHSLVGILVLLRLHTHGDQLDQQHHQPDQREEHDHQAADHIGVSQSNAVGVFLGGDLGDRFTEDDDQQRQDQRCQPGIAVGVQQEDHQHGGQRRGRDIDQIVADQDRAERVVKASGDLQRDPGPLRAVVTHVLQAQFIAGGIGHLTGREKGGQRQTNNNADDHKGDRHASPPPSCCSERSRTRSLRMRLCSISDTVTCRLW